MPEKGLKPSSDPEKRIILTNISIYFQPDMTENQFNTNTKYLDLRLYNSQ